MPAVYFRKKLRMLVHAATLPHDSLQSARNSFRRARIAARQFTVDVKGRRNTLDGATL
jgi:hypothetical protein